MSFMSTLPWSMYSEYDTDTGIVAMEPTSDKQEGREVQELLSKDMVDMSILTKGNVDTGGEEAGRNYDSDNSIMPQRSQNTEIYINKIFGFKNAVKMATQNKSTSPGGPASEVHPSPANDRDIAKDKTSSTTGSPLTRPEEGYALGVVDK